MRASSEKKKAAKPAVTMPKAPKPVAVADRRTRGPRREWKTRRMEQLEKAGGLLSTLKGEIEVSILLAENRTLAHSVGTDLGAVVEELREALTRVYSAEKSIKALPGNFSVKATRAAKSRFKVGDFVLLKEDARAPFKDFFEATDLVGGMEVKKIEEGPGGRGKIRKVLVRFASGAQQVVPMTALERQDGVDDEDEEGEEKVATLP
jgi:hypothetical protein